MREPIFCPLLASNLRTLVGNWRDKKKEPKYPGRGWINTGIELKCLVHRKPILQIIRKIFCSRNNFPIFPISLCCSHFVLSFTFTANVKKFLFHG